MVCGSKNGKKWTYNGENNKFYQTEHDELFASIRNGRPINNGEYMAYSTLLAIMGRMATYTGLEITWDMALNSQEDLSPKKYEWGSNRKPQRSRCLERQSLSKRNPARLRIAGRITSVFSRSYRPQTVALLRQPRSSDVAYGSHFFTILRNL